MLKRLFQPVDIASLVFFRIAFGILGFADVIGEWVYYHLMTDSFNPENLQFKYYGFEWAKALPEPLFSIIILFTAAMAVLIILGKWYKIATTLFFFGFTYTFLLEKAHYLNHGYVFCWVCFVMIFLPANRAFSLDVIKNPSLERSTIPYWCLFVPQFLMGVVYFYGGIAKINPDWLQAIPLKQWIASRADRPVIGPLLKYETTAFFMAYGGLLLDLTAPLFLSLRRTRPWFFLGVIFFHFVNSLIFAIGIFPSLSLALSALYFQPDFPRRWIRWLSNRIAYVKRKADWWANRERPADHQDIWQSAEHFRRPILLALGVVVAIHMLIPLRHHLFPGDVTWTEEGHRYSWRMMLRGKSGYGTFIVVDKETGEEEKINPREYLTKKQGRKVFTHPDMILQFAHFLRDKYHAEGKDVAIYADIKVKLNYRKHCRYIDPEIDLAAVEWQFFTSSPWILPEER
jgi:vitamin K-dependent gamma-carboxylase